MEPVIQAKGKYLHLMLCLVALALCFFIHQLSFFIITRHANCIQAGINKAVQTICVFVFSAVFFCAEQASQCFTTGKMLSLVTVLVAVLMYAHASGMQSHMDKNGSVRTHLGKGSKAKAQLALQTALQTDIEEQKGLITVTDASGQHCGQRRSHISL